MKKKVLIVEDDPAIQDVIKMMLEEGGYETATTRDAASIKGLKDNLPHLLLLDLSLSGMDGQDICKFLKARPPFRDIPIVLVSARRDLEKIAREVGANDFLAKPFEMNDLLDKVANLI